MKTDLRKTVCDAVLKEKLICIFRGAKMSYADLEKAVDACRKAGAHIIEITYSHDDPQASLDAIARLKQRFGDEMIIGAGTVLRKKEALQVIEANGDFNVSPALSREVIDATHEHGRFCMPGVATATEIVEAYDYGADILKLFPALEMGFGYAKALMKPLGFAKYFAVCKMTETNYEECLKTGFVGAGISSSINDPKLIQAQAFDEIQRRVERYRSIAEKY